jgi:hypothetical protein
MHSLVSVFSTLFIAGSASADVRILKIRAARFRSRRTSSQCVARIWRRFTRPATNGWQA